MNRPTHEDIIENLTDGTVAVTAPGVGDGGEMEITVFSRGAEELTGISKRRSLGKAASEVFKRDPWVAELLERTLKEEKLFTGREGTIHRSFSGPVRVSVSTLLTLDGEGRTTGAALIMKNLTGIKSLEAESLRKDRLSYIGTFAANLAHEVRNPLLGIRGSAQLLDRKVSDEKLREFTGVIMREADRLNNTVEQMLDFTRPSKLNITSLNIHQILDKVVLLLKEGGQSGKVAKEFDPSLPPVLGDDGQLTQVFLNLIKNAVEAAGKKGEVTVKTRVATDFHRTDESAADVKFASIEIRDNGPGIAEENMDKIFTPFFTTKAGGSGLGDEHNAQDN